MVYVIQVLLTACEQDQDPACNQQYYMLANLWHKPYCVCSEKTPGDGPRNSPKHVEFYSKNKFEKLVHLVSFIIWIQDCIRKIKLISNNIPLFISVFNQLYAQNLFQAKFHFMPLHVSSTYAHHQEIKIALHSLWYHHTYMCDGTKGLLMMSTCARNM